MPDLGRFLTQDRFAEKYLDLTQYQYGANNPILNIDVNGDSLAVTGTQDAVTKFTGIVDAGLGGFYKSKVNDNGLVTMEATDKKGEMTEEQKAFYGVMSGLTDLTKGKVGVGLVESDQNVLIGSYDLGAIDVDDVQKFSNSDAANSAGVISHELVEQSAKQLEGKSYGLAHQKGMQAEDKVNNSYRGSNQSTTSVTKNGSGQISGNLDIRYTKTTTRIVSINITNNNVTSVTEK